MDRDGDGVPETLEVTWDVPVEGDEVCVRVETRDATVWASYTLEDDTCASRASSVSAGGENTCGILRDGTVACWGLSSQGQLGDGRPQDGPFHAQAVRAAGLTGVRQVSVGGAHACAVVDGGAVSCWGEGGRGQLGDGTLTDQPTPVQVVGLPPVIQVSAGEVADRGTERHTCAVTVDGTVFCWGANITGEVGIPGPDDVPTPRQVPDLSGVTRVDAGGHYTCALGGDGRVQCWGGHIFGVLGDGCLSASPLCDRPDPRPVEGLEGAVDLSAGANHACAVRGDGAVFCWGQNGEGKLGDPTLLGANSSHAAPVQVAGITDAIEVLAGGNHTCARTAGGQVFCWGANFAGQLATGDLNASPTPLLVRNLSSVASVSAGGDHVCALADDGMIQCWGNNSNGQLATADVAFATAPRPAEVCP